MWVAGGPGWVKISKKGKSAYARFVDGGEISLLIKGKKWDIQIYGTILHGWLLTP